jgi:hypothetical protein
MNLKNLRLRPFAFRAELDVFGSRREYVLAKIIRALGVI